MPQYCSVPGCRNLVVISFLKKENCNLNGGWLLKRRDTTTKGLWKPGKHDVESSTPRSSKYSRRDDVDSSVVNNVQLEVEVGNEAEVKQECDDLGGIEPMHQEMGVQCPILGRFSIENLVNDPKRIQYYTSFRDYDHFMLFFNCLGPAVNELNYQCLSLTPKDQLFMCLMKLRQNKEDLELKINIWPSRDIVTDYMPDDFKYKFATTRVILDATETPIQKPSHVDAQSVTWSSYKHKNTIKTMIGCTPRGTVSYVSDAYGGSKDSIMADRGIMVQDLFSSTRCESEHSHYA
ncbi:unnamed protein product [Mytilus coruscus]|uniref:DDE Tnp4 domain-containing protein n=1 Tax=Mytilus coruscus TaxID=42192 RepID=A0A6J8BA02_MYTCO|nr:unnamed protein product [Mytilus coruscus]